MICVVLHCDTGGCDREQAYPTDVIERESNAAGESYGETATRLGAMYGWRYVDGEVTCPFCAGCAG